MGQVMIDQIQQLGIIKKEGHAAFALQFQQMFATSSSPSSSATSLIPLASDGNVETLHKEITQSLSSHEKMRSGTRVGSELGPYLPAKDFADDTIAVTASPFKKTCDQFCNCSCHLNFCVRSPQWLEAALGALFLRYSGTPILRRNPCNNGKCRRSGDSSTISTYYFPRWALSRALLLSGTWKYVGGLGAAWSIKAPQVIPFDSMVWRHAWNGSLDQLQFLLRERPTSLMDMDPSGETLLHVSVYFQITNVC
jgi:hypothetical protein